MNTIPKPLRSHFMQLSMLNHQKRTMQKSVKLLEDEIKRLRSILNECEDKILGCEVKLSTLIQRDKQCLPSQNTKPLK